jgi:hypothetical protein
VIERDGRHEETRTPDLYCVRMTGGTGRTDKQGELQMNLIGDPWNLVDVLDWKGTPGVN